MANLDFYKVGFPKYFFDFQLPHDDLEGLPVKWYKEELTEYNPDDPDDN